MTIAETDLQISAKNINFPSLRISFERDSYSNSAYQYVNFPEDSSKSLVKTQGFSVVCRGISYSRESNSTVHLHAIEDALSCAYPTSPTGFNQPQLAFIQVLALLMPSALGRPLVCASEIGLLMHQFPVSKPSHWNLTSTNPDDQISTKHHK